MDHDERVPGALSGKADADHGLAHSGWRDEDAVVVLEQRPDGSRLDRSEFTSEAQVKPVTQAPLIFGNELTVGGREEPLEFGAATARQGDVL
jgi:hypothetical protein